MVPGRPPLPTSQRHCARNTSSRHAASTCGRPNRSPLKNRTMGTGECFTMARDESGNFRAMDEPRNNLPGELDEASSAPEPPAIASDADPVFALTRLSPAGRKSAESIFRAGRTSPGMAPGALFRHVPGDCGSACSFCSPTACPTHCSCGDRPPPSWDSPSSQWLLHC